MSTDVSYTTQAIGALPAIQSYFQRLDIAATIDRLVPSEAELPLGPLVEIFIANRLLRPTAMFRLGGWAQQLGFTDFYQLDPAKLNDDRFGRVLERIAAHADTIESALVLRAIHEFDVDVSQIHRDITSVELYGAYEQPLPQNRDQAQCPQPTYGHSKSGKKHVKQIQLELSVAADGGVPLLHQTLDGNTPETSTHQEHLRRLQQTLSTSNVLHIGDSKHDTQENLLNIVAAKGRFLCAGAFTEALQQRYLKIRDKMRRIAYCPNSQASLPVEQRDVYQAHEVEELLQGEVKGRRVRCRYRLIFVYSEARARQQRQTRERHVAKIRAEFEAVTRNLNKYSLKSREAIVRRLEKAQLKYAEGSLFRYELAGRAGGFRLTWGIDGRAQAEWEKLEGVFVLKTNLSRSSHPVVDVLEKYKGQSQVEKRFHHVKGPLSVTPLFLEKPERMAGLVCVVVWALLVMALMERQVRRQLNGKPLCGLYPENRPSPAPTGPAILACFETVAVVVIRNGAHVSRHLSEFTGIQIKLLSLLRVSDEHLRMFKRRCGM